jgi:hypothetical protein
LIRSADGFAFGYRCDCCSRPEIVALTLPAGWEPRRREDGHLDHVCSLCWFDEIVAVGWTREVSP